MSLLKEIQDGALDTNVPITTVLRKLAVLAAQLKNDELRDWAFSELNGYTGQDVKLPTYRELGASPHGNLSQPGWQQNNAPIPSLILPEGLRERADMLDFRQPIAEIESLAVGDGDGVVFNWPGDWVLWAQKEGKFARGVVLHAIWQKVSKAAVVGIVDTVRTRILEFCI
jgi:hypothetical protein